MAKTKSRIATIYDKRYRRLLNWLVEERKKQGIKQNDIAEQTGLGQWQLSKIERFERRMDALEFLDYLHFLGLDYPEKLEELLALTEKK